MTHQHNLACVDTHTHTHSHTRNAHSYTRQCGGTILCCRFISFRVWKWTQDEMTVHTTLTHIPQSSVFSNVIHTCHVADVFYQIGFKQDVYTLGSYKFNIVFILWKCWYCIYQTFEFPNSYSLYFEMRRHLTLSRLVFKYKSCKFRHWIRLFHHKFCRIVSWHFIYLRATFAYFLPRSHTHRHTYTNIRTDIH